MARIIALDILKAAPQHAQDLGTTGLAMLLAITTRWDSLGGTVAVKWSNRTLADRAGLSPHSVPNVRKRLMELGWVTYRQAGMHAGQYVPHIPGYHIQSSFDEVEYVKADTSTFTSPTQESHKSIQVTNTSAFTSPTQEILSYIPSPIPSPVPDPIAIDATPVAKAPKVKSDADILIDQHPFKISGPKRGHKPVVNEIIKLIGVEEAGNLLSSIEEPLWPDRLMAAANRWHKVPEPSARPRWNPSAELRAEYDAFNLTRNQSHGS